MDTTHLYYIAVKGSLHANDAQVFGLVESEVTALKKKCGVQDSVLNGHLVKEPAIAVINHLSQLGYRIVCCSGEALYNDLDRVGELVGKGVDVNMKDKGGYTALHYAARAGHFDMCCVLLAAGADVNAATRAGLATPLHRAAAAGKEQVLDLLLEKGADPNCIDDDGKTLLHRAAESGLGTLVRKIATRYPALVHAADHHGNTPAAYDRTGSLLHNI